MALTNMKVFNEYVVLATIETVSQEIDKFNSASNGAIILSAEGFDGDFMQKSMFASLHSTQRRVDRYAENGTVAATALTQIEENIVKVAGGFGPVIWEPAQLSWIQQNEALAIEAISKNLAEAIMQDQLNSGIAAAVAAIGNVVALTTDVSATTGLSQSGLNTSHSKFGDRSMSLIAQVMTGAAYHKLIGEALNNNDALFSASNVTVVNILNKAVIVTDAPALYAAGTTNISNVLSLTSGGIIISNAGGLISNIETSNNKDRIETTFQADYDFGVGVKGFAWDTVNGGKSPTDAELATGTNWDKFVSSVKDTAGVLLKTDADQ